MEVVSFSRCTSVDVLYENMVACLGLLFIIAA